MAHKKEMPEYQEHKRMWYKKHVPWQVSNSG